MLAISLLAIFSIGITAIALEDKIGINKAATALLMSIISWILLSLSGDIQDFTTPFVEHLGEITETLFFVLGALTMIELVDNHGGFRFIISIIKTSRKRKLLWILSIMTFILSALLDNIAAGVIVVSIIRKIVPTQEDRLIFACMTIIAANAGGSFSPIGDVTTILLWTGGNITPLHQISHLLLPALTSMAVPLALVSLRFGRHDKWVIVADPALSKKATTEVSLKIRVTMISWAIITMITVPVFQQWTSLPPFMHVFAGLATLWIYTDIMHRQHPEIGKKMNMCDALSRADLGTILFFFGILMSVAALNTAGVLGNIGTELESLIDNPLGISFVIGAMSSLVDNIALVAATQGMYPIEAAGTYMVDSPFWTFLSYCAVTGGSLLIIGSATGVTIMGMEKIKFGYYLKKFSLYALLGYAAGAGVFLLLNS